MCSVDVCIDLRLSLRVKRLLLNMAPQNFTLQQRIYLVEYYLIQKKCGTVQSCFATLTLISEIFDVRLLRCFSLLAAALQVVCARAIPRVWRHCTCTTEGMSVSSPVKHQARHTPHCPSVGNIWTRAMMSTLLLLVDEFVPLGLPICQPAIFIYGEI